MQQDSVTPDRTVRTPERNIAIMGLPRSGTTWLAKIFDSHPATLYLHEPDAGTALSPLPIYSPDRLDDDLADQISKKYLQMIQAKSAKVRGKLPLFQKQYRGFARNWMFQSSVATSIAASKVNIDIGIPDVIGARQKADIRLVWKSVISSGRVGALARLLPECRFVYIVRHPCGQVGSVLRGNDIGTMNLEQFESDEALEHHWLAKQMVETGPAKRHGLTFERMSGISQTEFLAWQWWLDTELAIEADAALDNVFLFRYEDLCRDPKKMSETLFEFADLPMDPQSEAFLEQSTSKTRDRYFSVYKDPLEASQKWRKQLPPERIEEIMRIAGQAEAGKLFEEDAPVTGQA